MEAHTEVWNDNTRLEAEKAQLKDQLHSQV